jgi:hypothetical protein
MMASESQCGDGHAVAAKLAKRNPWLRHGRHKLRHKRSIELRRNDGTHTATECILTSGESRRTRQAAEIAGSAERYLFKPTRRFNDNQCGFLAILRLTPAACWARSGHGKVAAVLKQMQRAGGTGGSTRGLGLDA